MTTDGNTQVTIQELDEGGKPRSRSGPEGPDGSQAMSNRGVNPFIVVLWILDAGLLISGIAMIGRARDPFASGPAGPGYMPLSYILLNIAPYALLAAALTAATLLFWHARQWQQRHGG